MTVSKCLLTLVLSLGLTVPAFAQHDHDHDNHPDIELHLDGDGSTLEIRGPGVLHNHEHYEFVKPGSNWQTFHDSLNWPGVGGEFTPADDGKTFSLVATSPLYHWSPGDGAFAPVTDNTYVEIEDAGGINGINVDKNTVNAVLPGIASVNSSGDVHTHPRHRLIRDSGDPADGAYLFLFHVDPSDENWTNTETHALLYHKGLTHEQYEQAADLAGAQFGLSVPEPGTIALLGAAGMMMFRRRRT